MLLQTEEPSSNTKVKLDTHSHKIKIGENEGITAFLDRMTNSFDRMVERMDDKDIQEVLCETALIPDLSRQ